MLVVVNQGGLAPGGNNFDCKLRREATDLEDLFLAHIGGMDCIAGGLRAAVRAKEDGYMDKFVRQRYSSYDSELGKKINAGEATLEEVAAYAINRPEPKQISSKMEHMERLLSQYL